MKFTDGFWMTRPGVHELYGQEAYDIWVEQNTLRATVPTKEIKTRGDTLNRPTFAVSLRSPMAGVIGVRIDHHQGGRDQVDFDLNIDSMGLGEAYVDDECGRLISGDITATISRGAPWSLTFSHTDTGKVLTSSGKKSLGYIELDENAQVDGGLLKDIRREIERVNRGIYLHEQLSLGVGELVYGLGERFGPLVKNGQSIDIWNADGGTSSEQAYKNIPFYFTNRGYGIFVNHPGHVSYEVGSEIVERVQFSVAGESLEYYVIAGKTPVEIFDRYTALTGRPPIVPAWSYGLWLSTSFTTQYDEKTVTEFIEGMSERNIPVDVFHFDCFWMREFNWCDFEWDPRVFPDPEGMLARLHEKGLRVCVWLNPYIGQRSPLFREGKEKGYLVKRRDGSIWQWDMWQAGMALVDFTNPEATKWYQDHLRRLVSQGVDSFKTDFGERIPVDVEFFDGSSPERMHNLYTQLYNQAVFDVLKECRGEGQAVLFARSATAGGQQFPVHWGGDNSSTLESMAETLRGGLSLAMSGFGYWSHDIGGFEGMPDSRVFKRWVAFGLLSSHSRLHGSRTYRVPWLFDEADGIDEDNPESAVSVMRRFTNIKSSLMPYLYAAGIEANRSGVPVMRPMQIAFPNDPNVAYLDRQYMLGPDILVAPVFSHDGEVEFYLPEGEWTGLLTGKIVNGGRWLNERHALNSLPIYVRAGAVLVTGDEHKGADYDYLESVVLRVFPDTGEKSVAAVASDGRVVKFHVKTTSETILVSSNGLDKFAVAIANGKPQTTTTGSLEISRC